MQTNRPQVRASGRRAPATHTRAEPMSLPLFLLVALVVLASNMAIVWGSPYAGSTLCAYNALLLVLTVSLLPRSRTGLVFVVAAVAGLTVGIGIVTGTLDFNLVSPS